MQATYSAHSFLPSGRGNAVQNLHLESNPPLVRLTLSSPKYTTQDDPHRRGIGEFTLERQGISTLDKILFPVQHVIKYSQKETEQA